MRGQLSRLIAGHQHGAVAVASEDWLPPSVVVTALPTIQSHPLRASFAAAFSRGLSASAAKPMTSRGRDPWCDSVPQDVRIFRQFEMAAAAFSDCFLILPFVGAACNMPVGDGGGTDARSAGSAASQAASICRAV